MNRESAVCHRSGYYTTLGNLLDLYGPEFVSHQFGCQNLYLFVFDTHLPQTLCSGVIRGRHPSHFTKGGLKVKHFYKRRSIAESLQYDFSNIDFETHAYIHEACTVIQRHFRRWYGRNAIRLAKMSVQNNINLHTDLITCGSLHHPCMINEDWDSGSFVLYNYCTLLHCPLKKTYPIYVDADPITGQEYVEFREYQLRNEYDEPLYKSPFTGRLFTMYEIEFVYHKLWYKIAKTLAE